MYHGVDSASLVVGLLPLLVLPHGTIYWWTRV